MQRLRIVLSQIAIVLGAILFVGVDPDPALAQIIENPGELPGVLAGPIGSLTRVTPRLPDLTGIVINDAALLQLGKALFFDVGAGSDGNACASCHFAAGADNRVSHQLTPGVIDPRYTSADFGSGDVHFGGLTASGQSTLPPALRTDAADLSPEPTQGLKAGGQLATSGGDVEPSDFPTHRLADMDDRESAVLYTTNDVVSSQGTFAGDFHNVAPGVLQDECSVAPSPELNRFSLGGLIHRRVEPRNTPTVINAAFSHRLFWDGRANNVFNGVDPFGYRNENARLVWASGPAAPANLARIALPHAALASQAAGPPLSPFEMSCAGRTFADIARKLLPQRALETQQVRRDDSVLGSLSVYPSDGLTMTYGELVRAAFAPEWWQAAEDRRFTIDASGDLPVLAEGTSGHTQIESNFSMFWSIALMRYEASLISDDAPVDRYLNGDGAAMTPAQINGMAIFDGRGGCTECHNGPALSSAFLNFVDPLAAAAGIAGEQLVIRMPAFAIPEPGALVRPFRLRPAVLYDEGFYNIGVTSTVEDLGLGGSDPWGRPLSFTRQYIRDLMGTPPADIFSVNECFFAVPFGTDVSGFDDFLTAREPMTCNSLPQIGLIAPVTETFRPTGLDQIPHLSVHVDGAFKTPTLRNIGLTAPYMHNGGFKDLREVIRFYNRGGNRRGDYAVLGRDVDGSLIPDPAFPGDTTGSGLGGRAVGAAALEGDLVENQRLGSNASPVIVPLGLTDQDQDQLFEFLLALTDDRVACMKPPFDGPELPILQGPSGSADPAHPERSLDRTGGIPATGAGGLPALGLPCAGNAGSLFDSRLRKLGAVDADSDGVAYPMDNCVAIPNLKQTDSDGDGFGNACDADLNNDGLTNFGDFAGFVMSFNSMSSSGNYSPAADLTSDGFVNFADFAMFVNLWGKSPGPSGKM